MILLEIGTRRKDKQNKSNENFYHASVHLFFITILFIIILFHKPENLTSDRSFLIYLIGQWTI